VSKKINKTDAVEQLNNLQYNYSVETQADFSLNIAVNCFINLLLITGQDVGSVVKEYMDKWKSGKENEMQLSIRQMYETIKKNKIEHPISESAHLEFARKGLEDTMKKLNTYFGHVLKTSGLVDLGGNPLMNVNNKNRPA
jgi:hypothetical protein